MPQESPIRELRLALTVENFDDLVRFYRDVFGLPEIESWDEPTGRGMILDAGRATLELLSPDQTDLVDRIEVGEAGVSGPVRLALEVEDSVEMAQQLTDAGAEHVGGPVVTPWQHRNIRLRAPDGMQITLFTVLKEAEES